MCMGKKINVTVSMTRVSMFIIIAIAYHQYMYKCTHTYLPPFLPVCVCVDREKKNRSRKKTT